jgi:hypothetical protein
MGGLEVNKYAGGVEAKKLKGLALPPAPAPAPEDKLDEGVADDDDDDDDDGPDAAAAEKEGGVEENGEDCRTDINVNGEDVDAAGAEEGERGCVPLEDAKVGIVDSKGGAPDDGVGDDPCTCPCPCPCDADVELRVYGNMGWLSQCWYCSCTCWEFLRTSAVSTTLVSLTERGCACAPGID